MFDTAPNKRTVYDWVIEIISFLGMIVTCIPLFFYKRIDDEFSFPIHYSHYGNADGWGDKSFLFIFILVAIVLYIVLTFSEKFPKMFNYLAKTEKQNSLSIYRIRIQLVRHIKLFIMLIFSYMSNTFLYQALSGSTERPYNFILTWLLGLLVGVIVLSIIRVQSLE